MSSILSIDPGWRDGRRGRCYGHCQPASTVCVPGWPRSGSPAAPVRPRYPSDRQPPSPRPIPGSDPHRYRRSRSSHQPPAPRVGVGWVHRRIGPCVPSKRPGHDYVPGRPGYPVGAAPVRRSQIRICRGKTDAERCRHRLGGDPTPSPPVSSMRTDKIRSARSRRPSPAPTGPVSPESVPTGRRPSTSSLPRTSRVRDIGRCPSVPARIDARRNPASIDVDRRTRRVTPPRRPICLRSASARSPRDPTAADQRDHDRGSSHRLCRAPLDRHHDPEDDRYWICADQDGQLHSIPALLATCIDLVRRGVG